MPFVLGSTAVVGPALVAVGSQAALASLANLMNALRYE